MNERLQRTALRTIFSIPLMMPVAAVITDLMLFMIDSAALQIKRSPCAITGTITGVARLLSVDAVALASASCVYQTSPNPSYIRLLNDKYDFWRTCYHPAQTKSFSQADLGKLVGTSDDIIGKYERDEVNLPLKWLPNR